MRIKGEMIASTHDPGDATDTLPTRLSLLSRIRDPQNQSGWDQFYDTYSHLIYNFAKRTGLTDIEAEEVVQETVIDVSEKIAQFRYDPARGSFKTWLLTIAKRRSTDRFRRRTHKVGEQQVAREQFVEQSVLSEKYPSDSEVENIWTEEWKNHVLTNALDKLKTRVKPLQFQIFHLLVMKGLTTDDVRQRLGVSTAEIYWARYRLSRILKQLMREVEEIEGLVNLPPATPPTTPE